MNRGTLTQLSAALSAGLLISVWGATLVPWVFPKVGPMGLVIVAILGLAGAAAIIFIPRKILDSPSARSLGAARGLAVWAAPALSTVLLVISWASSGGYPSWAMRGDMAWNTVQSLLIHADGGVVPAIHPNPAPLTNVLFAIAYGPAAQPSLASVFSAHAVVILFVAMLASVLSGRYVAERAAHLHPLVSWGAVVTVGLLPYAGVMLGSVELLGHANMLTSYLVLWLTWIVYSAMRWHPAVRISLLFALSTIIVACWAPLVTVPISLILVAAIDWWRVRQSGVRTAALRWGVLIAGLVQFAMYLLLVTLPDLRREGAALSQDGGAFSISPKLTAVILVAVAVAAALTWVAAMKVRTSAEGLVRISAVDSSELERYESVRAVSMGVLAMLFISIPAIGYLMLQRVGMDSLWGYYPVKYVLLLTTVTAGVLLGSAVAALRDSSGVSWQVLVLGAAAILVLLPVLAPFGWKPSATSLAPAVRLAAQPMSAAQVSGIDDLVVIADAHRGEANLYIDDDAWSEDFVNFYLIQLSAQRSTDAVRSFAFAADQLSREQLCSLIETWDRPVNVFTGEDQAGRAQSLETCSAGRVTLEPVASVR